MQHSRPSSAAKRIGWFIRSRDRSCVSYAESNLLDLSGYIMRNVNPLPTRRSASGRSNCVTLKLLYKICVYVDVLKILIKFLFMLFLSFFSLPLLLPVIPSFCSSCSVDQREWYRWSIFPNEPSWLDRREINETRPSVTHVTLTRGVFIISYPYSSWIRSHV